MTWFDTVAKLRSLVMLDASGWTTGREVPAPETASEPLPRRLTPREACDLPFPY